MLVRLRRCENGGGGERKVPGEQSGPGAGVGGDGEGEGLVRTRDVGRERHVPRTPAVVRVQHPERAAVVERDGRLAAAAAVGRQRAFAGGHVAEDPNARDVSGGVCNGRCGGQGTYSNKPIEPALHDCVGVWSTPGCVCRWLQGKCEPSGASGAL